MLNKKINKTITFITPSLDRKGSEIALINLLQYINSEFQIKLISRVKGVLFDKVLLQIKKDTLSSGKISRTYYSRIKTRLAIKLNTVLKLSNSKQTTFYINTIILPEILDYAEQHKIKTVVHIHELEQMYVQLDEKQIQRLVAYPELIIANSQASAAVIKKFGRIKNIEICYPSVETSAIKPNAGDYKKYRKKLNVDETTFLWVMSGSLDENKNPFLFIEIAKELLKKKNNVKFLWIGGTANKSFEKQCINETDSALLKEKIIWLGDVADEYYRYFSSADGFVLTSNKESFSLVTVEALLLGLPIVTQNCGGVLEILKNDIGKIVEKKNNAVLMATEMIHFMDGVYIVDKTKQLERAKEFDSATIAQHWNGILERYI